MCHPILALTPKEREAIALVREGLSNQQIADLMHISERTVQGHLYNASYKLNAKNRIELVLILENRLDTKADTTISYSNAKKLLKAKIKQLRDQGCSLAQISERTGLCYSSVRNHLANMGMPRREYAIHKKAAIVET
jgi:DNA-binding CsgD family transcriptional regulator